MILQEDKIIINVHAFNNRVFQIHEGSSQYTMIKEKKTSSKAKTKNEKRKRSKLPVGKEEVEQSLFIYSMILCRRSQGINKTIKINK